MAVVMDQAVQILDEAVFVNIVFAKAAETIPHMLEQFLRCQPGGLGWHELSVPLEGV